MLKCEGTADKYRCIDEDARCFGGHVPVGDDGNDNGIGHGSIEGLRSEEICAGKGCDEQMGSEGMSNVSGSDPSPSSTTRRRQQQTRPPKKKRNKIPTVLSTTPTVAAGPPALRKIPAGIFSNWDICLKVCFTCPNYIRTCTNVTHSVPNPFNISQ